MAATNIRSITIVGFTIQLDLAYQNIQLLLVLHIQICLLDIYINMIQMKYLAGVII